MDLRHRSATATAIALSAARAAAIDLVYPRRCSGCGRRGGWLCSSCDEQLARFQSPWCPRCGVPVAMGRCRCDRMPVSLQSVRSVGPFDGWLRGAIVSVKYHGEWSRVETLSEPLAEAIADLCPCDALVPVPLHPTRQRQRGFNQSHLLASHAARHLDIAVREPLMRMRLTAPQVGLGAVARGTNVSGAFAVQRTPVIAGQRLVLIDDVITTGATLAACAELLLESGAASVAVATVAREL